MPISTIIPQLSPHPFLPFKFLTIIFLYTSLKFPSTFYLSLLINGDIAFLDLTLLDVFLTGDGEQELLTSNYCDIPLDFLLSNGE